MSLNNSNDQPGNIEEPVKPNFSLRSRAFTNEAYFDVEGEEQIFCRTYDGRIFLVVCKHPTTGEKYYTLPTLPKDHNLTGSCFDQKIFPKYLNQNNKVFLNPEGLPMEQLVQMFPGQVEYPLMTENELIEGIIEGEETDGRLISAFFQDCLQGDSRLYGEIMLESENKWHMSRNRAFNFHRTNPEEVLASCQITSDPYMNLGVTQDGKEYYDNSHPEVLLVASHGDLFDHNGSLNLEAEIILNTEFSPAHGDMMPLLPGGMLENFTRDKPFIDKKTGVVDEEFKKLIHSYKNIYGPEVATALMELMQETFSKPGLKSLYYKFGQVHAGLGTTNSNSIIVVAERVVDNLGRMGKETGDEPIELITSKWKVKHVLAGIKAGVITDTRIIATFAKLYFNYREPKQYLVASEA